MPLDLRVTPTDSEDNAFRAAAEDTRGIMKAKAAREAREKDRAEEQDDRASADSTLTDWKPPDDPHDRSYRGRAPARPRVPHTVPTGDGGATSDNGNNDTDARDEPTIRKSSRSIVSTPWETRRLPRELTMSSAGRERAPFPFSARPSKSFEAGAPHRDGRPAVDKSRSLGSPLSTHRARPRSRSPSRRDRRRSPSLARRGRQDVASAANKSRAGSSSLSPAQTGDRWSSSPVRARRRYSASPSRRDPRRSRSPARRRRSPSPAHSPRRRSSIGTPPPRFSTARVPATPKIRRRGRSSVLVVSDSDDEYRRTDSTRRVPAPFPMSRRLFVDDEAVEVTDNDDPMDHSEDGMQERHASRPRGDVEEDSYDYADSFIDDGSMPSEDERLHADVTKRAHASSTSRRSTVVHSPRMANTDRPPKRQSEVDSYVLYADRSARERGSPVPVENLMGRSDIERDSKRPKVHKKPYARMRASNGRAPRPWPKQESNDRHRSPEVLEITDDSDAGSRSEARREPPTRRERMSIAQNDGAELAHDSKSRPRPRPIPATSRPPAADGADQPVDKGKGRAARSPSPDTAEQGACERRDDDDASKRDLQLAIAASLGTPSVGKVGEGSQGTGPPTTPRTPSTPASAGSAPPPAPTSVLSVADLLARYRATAPEPTTPAPAPLPDTPTPTPTSTSDVVLVRRCTRLPVACEVNDVALQDAILAVVYKSLPHLRKGELIGWSYQNGEGHPDLGYWALVLPHIPATLLLAALNFVGSGDLLNFARASPLEVALRVWPNSDRLHIYCPGPPPLPVIGVSCGAVQDCKIVKPVGSGILQKWIKVVLHTQEHERTVSFIATATGYPTLAAQFAKNAIQFTTRPAPFQKASPSAGTPGASRAALKAHLRRGADSRTKATMPAGDDLSLAYDATIPVYDGTHLVDPDFNVILRDLPGSLPLFKGGEVPFDSFVMVGYITTIFTSKDRGMAAGFNLKWIVVLGVPDAPQK